MIKRKISAITFFLVLLLLISKAFTYKVNDKVNDNIYSNVKKYHLALIKDVDNLKNNNIKENEFSLGVEEFLDNCKMRKNTKKETELLNALLDEAYNYERMKQAQKEGKTAIFNERLSAFEKKSNFLDNYFKK